MTTLVMWSGGIDSTYRLAQLLKETSVPVRAHHIHLINREGRASAEHRSVRALIPKLEKIRPFLFSESTVDHSKMRGIPYDMAITCVEAGYVAKDAYESPQLGKIKTWMIGTHEAEGHWQERWEAIAPIVRGICWPQDAPAFELGKLVSKEEEMHYLKRWGMLDECWFCRYPQNEEPCGRCKTCREVFAAREQKSINLKRKKQ